MGSIKGAALLGQPLKFLTSGRIARNRFLKSALSEYLCPWCPESRSDIKGVPSERLINLYDKWGHGGFGVVMTGNLMVDQNHLESPGNLIITKELESEIRRDACRRLTEAAKSGGSLIMAQLSHAGRQCPVTVNPHPFSASDVQLLMRRASTGFGVPVPLKVEQIKSEVIDRFVYAAKYCADVGFDGVQLHCAHGYLLSQFLSPTTNKRNDQYGGSVENRARIVREIYEEIRKTVPKDLIIGVKVNSVEFQKDGLNLADACAICETFDKMGLDFIELSGGTYENLAFHYKKESTKKREAFFLDFADEVVKHIKHAVVYVTGGFRTVKGMTDAIESGSTQGIGLGRPAGQEPDLPIKLISGKSTRAIPQLIDYNDFFLTLIATNTQMAQIAMSPYKPGEDLCANIMDLSHQKTVDEFLAAVSEFNKKNEEKTKRGEVPYGVMEFRTNM